MWSSTLVENDDVEVGELVELALEAALLVRLDEQRDKLGGSYEPHAEFVLAVGHPHGDRQLGSSSADATEEDEVAGVGDEVAAEDLQDRVGVESWLRVECEGVESFEHRQAGVLNAALDAPLPASGLRQMHQLRQVVGRHLTLAGGLQD